MIRLRTLGALDLVDAGGNELRSVLAQPKRAALVAHLALAAPRGPQRRDTLLALFWPDQDEDHARRALSQAVHFLRKALGAESLISRNDAELLLDPGQFWCDAIAFEEALHAGRLTDALDLYRGDLLEGFHIAGAPEFERWLGAERGRLSGRYAQAIEAAAEDRERDADFAGAVAHWRRLAARDALSSRVALRLMRALAAAGDPAGAVQHARIHETLLREELNVPPDPAVMSLVRQLRSVRVKDHPSQLERNAPRVEKLTSEPVRAERSPSRHRAGRRPAAMLAAGLACVLVFGRSSALVGDESDLRELLVRGHSAEQNRSPTGIETAKRYYRRAIEVDPGFAPGYAALSRIYALTALFGYAPAATALDSARQMAVSAVARDDELPEAHTALAMSLGDARDFDGAEREFVRAIQLDQNNADAHYWYAILLVALGRAHDARREVELALKLDALLPLRGVKMVQRASAYLETGKRPPAQWDSINVLEPGDPWARRGRALDLAARGRCPEARAEIEAAERQAPDVIQMLFAIVLIDRFCGEAERARELMERLKKHPRAHDDGVWIAMTHAPFGERDSAFVWIEHQVWTTAEITDLRVNRWLDSLRSDPRYEQLLRRLGLRPAPR